MDRRTFTPEQIINKLREAEIHLSQGDTVGVARYSIVTELIQMELEYSGIK